jgi:hypothetical protein
MITAISLSLLGVGHVQAVETTHNLYLHNGITKLDDQRYPQEAWVITKGYNYDITPLIGFDLGYVDTSSANSKLLYSNALDSSYKGLFGGARLTRPIMDIGLIYAKGGLSYTQVEQNRNIPTDNSILLNGNFNPYFSVGATLPTSIDHDFNINLELSYQDLELNYGNTMFTVGAQYHF